MPRHAHVPTSDQRRIVKNLVGMGMPRATIAETISISPKTLEKHYVSEIATGSDKANASVASKLYRQATSDSDTMPNTVARIFWMKARGGWKETTAVEHSGDDMPLLRGGGTVNVYLPDNGRGPPPIKVIEGRALKTIAAPRATNTCD